MAPESLHQTEVQVLALLPRRVLFNLYTLSSSSRPLHNRGTFAPCVNSLLPQWCPCLPRYLRRQQPPKRMLPSPPKTEASSTQIFTAKACAPLCSPMAGDLTRRVGRSKRARLSPLAFACWPSIFVATANREDQAIPIQWTRRCTWMCLLPSAICERRARKASRWSVPAWVQAPLAMPRSPHSQARSIVWSSSAAPPTGPPKN